MRNWPQLALKIDLCSCTSLFHFGHSAGYLISSTFVWHFSPWPCQWTFSIFYLSSFFQILLGNCLLYSDVAAPCPGWYLNLFAFWRDKRKKTIVLAFPVWRTASVLQFQTSWTWGICIKLPNRQTQDCLQQWSLRHQYSKKIFDNLPMVITVDGIRKEGGNIWVRKRTWTPSIVSHLAEARALLEAIFSSGVKGADGFHITRVRIINPYAALEELTNKHIYGNDGLSVSRLWEGKLTSKIWPIFEKFPDIFLKFNIVWRNKIDPILVLLQVISLAPLPSTIILTTDHHNGWFQEKRVNGSPQMYLRRRLH